MKAKRFHGAIGMFQYFKSHVIPTLEFPTPAIYHATADNLNKLDRVQRSFLIDMGVSAEDALMDNRF